MRRNHFILTVAAAMAIALTAPLGAAAQDTDIGGQYQLTTNAGDGRGRVDGFGLFYDRLQGANFTLAANVTYGMEHGPGGQKSIFGGVGPGYRRPLEHFDVYAHFLVGVEHGRGTMYGRKTSRTEFRPRGGAGISYRLKDNLRLRAGEEVDTHFHVVVGAGVRF